jgi:hypothetical protein
MKLAISTKNRSNPVCAVARSVPAGVIEKLNAG